MSFPAATSFCAFQNLPVIRQKHLPNYLDPAKTGRGAGRQLYTALLRQLRDSGRRTVIAGIAQPNPASVGLHEALGFVPAAMFKEVGFKQNQWLDVGYWQLPLHTFQA